MFKIYGVTKTPPTPSHDPHGHDPHGHDDHGHAPSPHGAHAGEHGAHGAHGAHVSTHGHDAHIQSHDTHASHDAHDHGHGHGDHHAHGAPQHDGHHIDVDMHDGHDHETDIGQIALDILDCSSSIVIIAPVAGVDPADIDIGLSRNILTISGHRKEAPIYLDARRMLVEECFYGAFSRSIILPENLGFDQIKATVEHNVVIITIPKLTLLSKNIKIER